MPSSEFGAMPRPIASRRTAWLIVIIITALFLLALVAVIWGFVRQARIVLASRSAAVTAPAAVPGTGTGPGAAAVITLAPGAHIVSAGTDAGKLVLHVATPAGAEVDIIDLGTGKMTAQVKTAPAP